MTTLNEKTDRLGIAKTEFVFSSLGWLFREQFLHDHGIDAQVEIVQGEIPTGDLIAIQIKSGASYFAEDDGENIVFRTDSRHIEYWNNHALPVILVLYNPETDHLIWEVVSEDTSEPTGKHWKVRVPNEKVLKLESAGELRNGPPFLDSPLSGFCHVDYAASCHMVSLKYI